MPGGELDRPGEFCANVLSVIEHAQVPRIKLFGPECVRKTLDGSTELKLPVQIRDGFRSAALPGAIAGDFEGIPVASSVLTTEMRMRRSR